MVTVKHMKFTESLSLQSYCRLVTLVTIKNAKFPYSLFSRTQCFSYVRNDGAISWIVLEPMHVAAELIFLELSLQEEQFLSLPLLPKTCRFGQTG
jgi:hypothetical protein